MAELIPGGLILILLATNSYPFQPRESLLLFSWVAILTVVGVTFVIFVQISRDRVLSLLAGTTPGQVNVTRDFVFRVLFNVLLPVLALLGAQFPDALRKIFMWAGGAEGGH